MPGQTTGSDAAQDAQSSEDNNLENLDENQDEGTQKKESSKTEKESLEGQDEEAESFTKDEVDSIVKKAVSDQLAKRGRDQEKRIREKILKEAKAKTLEDAGEYKQLADEATQSAAGLQAEVDVMRPIYEKAMDMMTESNTATLSAIKQTVKDRSLLREIEGKLDGLNPVEAKEQLDFYVKLVGDRKPLRTGQPAAQGKKNSDDSDKSLDDLDKITFGSAQPDLSRFVRNSNSLRQQQNAQS